MLKITPLLPPAGRLTVTSPPPAPPACFGSPSVPLCEQSSSSLPVFVIVQLPSASWPSPYAGNEDPVSGLEATVGISTSG
jgi:hypothetical protein